MNRPRSSLEERFWHYTDKRGPDECWPWLGCKVGKAESKRDYGTIGVGGRNVRATHISWSIANGQPFPAGKLACHSCDNPWCVNPAHIWVGTPADNMRDMAEKGRGRNGYMAHPAKRLPRPPRVQKGRTTHCRNGHPYEGQRPYPSEGKRRRCRICHYRSNAARKAAVLAEQEALA